MNWQEIARTRHENEAVLRLMDEGCSREEIARRLGLGLFAVALIERRLARGGLRDA